LFRILSDATRLRIVDALLRTEELNVTELCKALDVRQPTISHHLSLMRPFNVVSARRRGKEVFYSLSQFEHRVAVRSMLVALGDKSLL
jgi:ArsR family transcriptional regulator